MVEPHRIVSSEEFLEARIALLAKEKEFTRTRDAVNQARRELPWEAVRGDYIFDGPDGKETLSALFDGRSQLIVYHFMFDPSWNAGCPICSFWADNFNPIITHLNQRDVTMIAVSRAPYAKLAAYRDRMGWTFKWMSSYGSDFNLDSRVSFSADEIASKRGLYNFVIQDPGETEREGVSVYYKDAADKVFRTYATYARGIDLLNTAYNYLDLVPKGRDEAGRGPFWVKRHDEYQR
jgi:predicted dithiol-disulfide oxidoreductase (DUF899 family)